MNASPITKITSWLKFLGKNLHLVGCATVCGKSEVMLTIKYIGNQFGTGRTDRGGYRSPSAGTSDLKKAGNLN